MMLILCYKKVRHGIVTSLKVTMKFIYDPTPFSYHLSNLIWLITHERITFMLLYNRLWYFS